MMAPSDRLRGRLEKGYDPGAKYACGMCPSCRRRSSCPGGTNGTNCPNYEPPEPTKEEWKEIYAKALREAETPRDAHDSVHKIGRVNAIRGAMQEIHGFTAEEIRTIEDDMHTDAGRGSILPGQ